MSLGGSSGSSSVQPVGQQTTVQRGEPWDQQKPYLEFGMQQAHSLYNTKQPQYYPGSTVVPFSGQTQDALAAAEQRARSGSPVQAGGSEQMLKTIRGDYLNPDSNPYLAATYKAASRPMVEQFRDATMPGIDSSFIKSGRYGSGAYADQQQKAQDVLGRNLGELATGIYGQNYQQERGRQDQAVANAPAYAQSDYNDAQALLGIGQQREGQAGRELQDEVNRWNFEQQSPFANLGNYMSLIGGDYGRTQTTSQPLYSSGSNTMSNLFGGLAGLGMLGSAFMPMFSSKDFKDRGPEPDYKSMPDKLASMDVPTWNYKGEGKKHMGPMAEDFRDTFGIGDGRTIDVVDAIGTLFAANKGLTMRLKEMESKSKPWGA